VEYHAAISTARMDADIHHPLIALRFSVVSDPAMNADKGVAGSVSHPNRFAPDSIRFIHAPIRHDTKPSHGPRRNPYIGATPETIPILAFSTPITGKPGR